MQCSHILKIVKTWLDVEISCLHCILWMLSLCSKHCQTSLTSLVATVTNISDVLWHGTPCTPWHPVPGYSYWWQQAALLTARWFAMWWRDVCRCPGSVWQQAQDIPHFMLGHHLPAPQQFLHPPAGPGYFKPKRKVLTSKWHWSGVTWFIDTLIRCFTWYRCDGY